jgi:hypothetical protein
VSAAAFRKPSAATRKAPMAGRKIKPSMKVDQPVASAVPPSCGPECCECVKGLLSAMYGRRPRCKRNLTFPRMSGAVMYSACCCSHFGRWP